MKRKKIIFKYLKTWFILDLAAVFPYFLITDMFISSNNSNDAALKTPQLLRLLKIMRFVRILRIIRIFKIGKLMYKLEEYIVTDTLSSIVDAIKLLTIILYVGHWLAWLFYFIGDYESSAEPLSWITVNKIIDSSLFTKYMTSYYWAFTTMTTVGYGDITPNTNNEMLFVMFGMIVAWGVFAYSVGSIGTIVNKSNLMTAEFRTRMLHINQFLMKRDIPNELRLKIMSYLDYLCEYKRMYKLDEEEALNMLNDNLRDQVIACINGNMLNNSGVFQAFNIIVLSQLTFKLRHHTYAIDDPIMEEESLGNNMYYVCKGSVVLIHKKTHTFIKEISLDAWWGELSFFSEAPRRVTVRSKNFTEVVYITKEDFMKIVKDDEDSLKIMKMIKRKIRKKKNLSGIGVSCYIWGRVGHISLDWKNFKKIKGNINKHLKRLQTEDLTILSDDSIQKKKTKSKRKTLTSKDYAQEQDKIIREAIKSTLFTQNEVNFRDLEKIIEKESIDEESLIGNLRKKKRVQRMKSKNLFHL
jgi:hypothetical protein